MLFASKNQVHKSVIFQMFFFRGYRSLIETSLLGQFLEYENSPKYFKIKKWDSFFVSRNCFFSFNQNKPFSNYYSVLFSYLFFRHQNCVCQCSEHKKIKYTNTKTAMVDGSCQTLSTGDIVITKVFFKEEKDRSNQKVLISSPKK